MVRVKICGITRLEDLLAAVDAGADAVGFVVGFSKSPRNLTVEQAAQLRRNVPIVVDAVLVTPYDEHLGERISRIKPDVVQLYGEYDPGRIREEYGVKVVKPLDISMATEPEKLRGFDAILVDRWGGATPGGTGMTVDWSEAAAFRERLGATPLILSGGLRPENVREAVERVKPYAVDVSSGVEKSPGVKDASKIRRFVENAKSASLD